MKYFSLDLETTGLNEDVHQVIEIGGVIDDLENPKPIHQLPKFHCYVTHEVYNVSEYCLKLHSDTGVFQNISERKDGFTYLEPDQVTKKLGKFIYQNYIDEEDKFEDRTGKQLTWSELYDQFLNSDKPKNFLPPIDFLPIEVTAAGKNFASFDKDFLDQIPRLQEAIRFHHRVLDPGSMYVRENDEKVPNLKTCLERAGFEDEVPHNALDDSILVLKLIRNYFGINTQ